MDEAPPSLTCSATKEDGTPCRARARSAGGLCAFHDPACRTATWAGRRAGGRQRSRPRVTLPASTQCPELRSVRDVCELLSGTIGDVRAGRLDPKIANTVGYLAGVLVRALEVGKIEERLAALEMVMGRVEGSETSSFYRDPPERLDAEETA